MKSRRTGACVSEIVNTRGGRDEASGCGMYLGAVSLYSTLTAEYWPYISRLFVPEACLGWQVYALAKAHGNDP